MILPNKLISFKDCTLAKTVPLLDSLSEEDKDIYILYKSTKKYFCDISEFVLALDILYVLNVIKYDESLNMVSYVNRNKM